MTRESENTKYLYGASVQGIQNFIFQTNELKDIIGASGLVEQICKNTFDKELKDNGNLIVQAAGKIKCIYSSKNECENAVKNFPKRVMEMAPGIIITQAVVKFESDFKKADEQLDKYLGIQRNKPAHSLSLGLMGITRSRKTGLPAIKRDGADYIDEPTDKKHTEKEYVKKLCKNCMGKIDYGKIAFDIDMMNDKNNWIAIIHADGNGFGKITQSIGDDVKNLEMFSRELDNITKDAAKSAFEKLDLDKNKIIPFRPIILGGDDLTVICRADLAIKYTKEFMTAFETKSADLAKKLNIEGLNKLTTCAGIAFIKSSYPFYYGYNLAEELCGQAKNDAKNTSVNGLAPSCLMFHKVQDSFVENYEAIVKRELTARESISFKYGPYYLSTDEIHGEERTIEFLTNNTNKFTDDKEGNALKSHLRQWISLLFTNPAMAKQEIARMKAIFHNDAFINKVTTAINGKIPVYDILSLHSVIYQETKNQNIENEEYENN